VARVLLIDGEFGAPDSIGPMLSHGAHELINASNGGEGIRAAKELHPDVALVALALPDMSGIHCLRELRFQTPWVACMVISDCASFECAKDALRTGARDWLDKPLAEETLLQAIRRVTILAEERPTELALRPAKAHAASRLAEVAVSFIVAPEDAPTLRLFSRAAAHSSGCLRNWCRGAAIKARAYRDFSRALRAVYRLEHRKLMTEANLLEIVDGRTLTKFLTKSGGIARQLPTSVDDFLRLQQFVRDPEFLAAVRTALQSPRMLSGGVARSVYPTLHMTSCR
jgi:DNA-binding NarL/FixJ family response regulator